ncbi:Long chain base biosynthesis protein 2a [Cucumispora dikerogammari]|nr:Long chain base biosynthesis protein 2a [Cucumispora dikerogammari]
MHIRVQSNQTIPISTMVSTYLSFLLIISVGHIEDLRKQIFRLFQKIFSSLKQVWLINIKKTVKKYEISSAYKNIPITTDFETFFVRRMFSRVRTCWHRTITGAPGKYITLVMSPENYKKPEKFLKDDKGNIAKYDEEALNEILRYNQRDTKYETDFDTKGLINLYNEYKFRNLKRSAKNLSLNEKCLIWEYSELKCSKHIAEPFFKMSGTEQKDIQTISLLNQLKKVLKPEFYGIIPINEIIKRKNIVEKCSLSKDTVLKTKSVLNLGSYNYLGFGSNDPEKIKVALKALHNYQLTVAAPIFQTGSLKPIRKLERRVSKFLETEDTLVFSMGFGTNSMTLPLLLKEDTLVLSDELNHRSLIFGTQLSRAVIKTFAHNDMYDLENKLRHYISQGQPITHRDWKKVFVLVEGVYSMEATVVPLDKLVALRKKYNFYIFVDEAHSIGVLGKGGKGVSRLFKHKLHESIDIYMGTFTKSFGGMGGYISGNSELINFLRTSSDGPLYGEQMPALIAAHIDYVLKEISVKGCKVRKSVQVNLNFMITSLKSEGFVVYGDDRSPIIPLLIFNPGKVYEFSVQCLKKNLAIVVVGFPATSILSSRARICLSGCHTKKEIRRATRIIIKIGKKLGMNIIK